MTSSASRIARAALAAMAAVGLVILAAPYSTPASAAPAAAKIMLVMDASGSMAGPADDGTPKIDAARSALNEVLDALPKEAEVGLRVFGASAEPNTPQACTDSELTAPLASGDRTTIKSAIATYSPKGETPISYALQEAAKDLGADGQRSIILVSDGVATCAPDPCEIAAEIQKSGVNVKIDVVGFGVGADAGAQSQLECVAAAGGGQYYDANSQQELTDSLSQLAKKAAKPYTATGEPVTGTPTVVGAPVITAGMWLDQIDVPGSTDEAHFYRIARKYPGSSLHINVVMPGGSVGDQLEVRTADDAMSTRDYSASDTTGVRSAGLLIDTRATTSAEGQMGDHVDFAVERKDVSDDDPPTAGPLPIQILITEEPAVDTVTGMPRTQEDAMSDDATGTFIEPSKAAGFQSTPQRASGGVSVDQAQEITSGSFQGNLAPGDLQIYKVPVHYGQFISAKLSFAKNSSGLSKLISDGKVNGTVEILDSTLTRRTLLFVDGGGSTTGPANDNVLKAQSSEVRYRNREGSSGALAIHDGYYYVAISTTDDANNKTYLVPFTLDIGVHGKPEGAPKYEHGDQPIGAGVLAESAQAADDSASSAENSSAGSKWLWAGIAAAGGLALIVAAGLIARRRSQAS